MSDQISIIHDTFDSKIYSTYVPYSLIPISCQEKSGKRCSAECRRSSTEATMRTFLKVYFLIPGDGYSTARTSLNGINRVCLLFSGSTACIRNHAVIQGFYRWLLHSWIGKDKTCVSVSLSISWEHDRFSKSYRSSPGCLRWYRTNGLGQPSSI